MPMWFYGMMMLVMLLVARGLGALAWVINRGTGVYGLNRPVMWGLLLVNFVF